VWAALLKQTCGAQASSKHGACNKNSSQLAQQPGWEQSCPPAPACLPPSAQPERGAPALPPHAWLCPQLGRRLPAIPPSCLQLGLFSPPGRAPSTTRSDSPAQGTHAARRALCTGVGVSGREEGISVQWLRKGFWCGYAVTLNISDQGLS